jgi:hypothetical protein
MKKKASFSTLPATIKISPEGRAHKLSLHPFRAGRRKCDSQKKTHTHTSFFDLSHCGLQDLLPAVRRAKIYVKEEKSCGKYNCADFISRLFI